MNVQYTKERLMLLANFLEKNVQDWEFDINTWWQIKTATSPDMGCACGWACMIPEIKNEGLYIKVTQWSMFPQFNQKSKYPAIASYFGISLVQAKYLFSSLYYGKLEPLKQEVIDRIRNFVGNLHEFPMLN